MASGSLWASTSLSERWSSASISSELNNRSARRSILANEVEAENTRPIGVRFFANSFSDMSEKTEKKLRVISKDELTKHNEKADTKWVCVEVVNFDTQFRAKSSMLQF